MIPRPRRRWFQYSLRALLVLVFLVSLPLSWFSARLQQQQTVEVIERLGGSVAYDYHWKGESTPGPEWARDLLGSYFFADVGAVGLVGSEISDSATVHRGAEPASIRLG